jgi:hypothetical protein
MNSFISWSLVTLGIGGIIATAVSVLWFKLDAKQAGVVLAASALLLVASQIHRVTALSFGGAEAKLDQKVAEADATLNELREAMATFSQAMLTVSMANEFMDGLPTRKRFEQHDLVMASLRDLKLTSAQLSKADSGWRQGLAIMYHRLFANVVTHQLASSENSNQERSAIVSRLHKLGDFNTWTSPSPAVLRDFLKKEGVYNAELEQWLEDYFLTTGELRRRDSFVYEASERPRAKKN